MHDLCFWHSSRWEDQQQRMVGLIFWGEETRSLPLLLVAVAVGGFACEVRL